MAVIHPTGRGEQARLVGLATTSSPKVKKIRHAKEADATGAKLTKGLSMTLGEVLGHFLTQFEPASDPTRITLHARRVVLQGSRKGTNNPTGGLRCF